jgi:hypothetical protein
VEEELQVLHLMRDLMEHLAQAAEAAASVELAVAE